MTKDKLWLLGLSGTNGSGKDTFGQILAEEFNYLFISVTSLLRAEVKRRGLPLERENARMVSIEWRKELGLSVLVDIALSKFETQSEKYSGLVISSIRNPGEADKIHELNGTMVWIDADPKVRYERVQANLDIRGRHTEDNITFKKFIEEEKIEMTSNLKDDAVLNMSKVKSKCDIFIENSQENLEVFKSHIEKALGL